MKAPLRHLLILIAFLPIGLSAQDSLGLKKNTIGVAVNRYLPDLDYETLPYFFGAEYRYKFGETNKYEHHATLRAAGNYNKPKGIKSFVSKIFIGGEIGYWAERKVDSTKWFFCWGASAGVYWTRERHTSNVTNLYYDKQIEPYYRSYYKIGFSPKVGFGYKINALTTLQFAFSIGIGTKLFGESDHLEFNKARGFSAQFPSVGIYHRF